MDQGGKLLILLSIQQHPWGQVQKRESNAGNNTHRTRSQNKNHAYFIGCILNSRAVPMLTSGCVSAGERENALDKRYLGRFGREM